MRQTFMGNRGGNRWRNVPKPKQVDAICAVCAGPIFIDTDRQTGEELGFHYCRDCGNAVRHADGSVPDSRRHDSEDIPF